jgi:hypothetical protein
MRSGPSSPDLQDVSLARRNDAAERGGGRLEADGDPGAVPAEVDAVVEDVAEDGALASGRREAERADAPARRRGDGRRGGSRRGRGGLRDDHGSRHGRGGPDGFRLGARSRRRGALAARGGGLRDRQEHGAALLDGEERLRDMARAPVGILVEQLQHQVRQARRQAGRGTTRILEDAGPDGRQHRLGRLPRERRRARERPVDQRSQREHVGGRVALAADQHLRSEVDGLLLVGAQRQEMGRLEQGRAPTRELDPARADIAVAESRGVERLERLRDVPGDADHALRVERPPREDVGQRGAVGGPDRDADLFSDGEDPQRQEVLAPGLLDGPQGLDVRVRVGPGLEPLPVDPEDGRRRPLAGRGGDDQAQGQLLPGFTDDVATGGKGFGHRGILREGGAGPPGHPGIVPCLSAVPACPWTVPDEVSDGAWGRSLGPHREDQANSGPVTR